MNYITNFMKPYLPLLFIFVLHAFFIIKGTFLHKKNNTTKQLHIVIKIPNISNYIHIL
jgi:hypothetical protein